MLITAALTAFPVPAALSAAAPGPTPLPQQWWFTTWDIQTKVWPTSKDAGATVAVVDTGVEAARPELRGAVHPKITHTLPQRQWRDGRCVTQPSRRGDDGNGGDSGPNNGCQNQGNGIPGQGCTEGTPGEPEAASIEARDRSTHTVVLVIER